MNDLIISLFGDMFPEHTLISYHLSNGKAILKMEDENELIVINSLEFKRVGVAAKPDVFDYSTV